jgi:hypothetical protein
VKPTEKTAPKMKIKAREAAPAVLFVPYTLVVESAPGGRGGMECW